MSLNLGDDSGEMSCNQVDGYLDDYFSDDFPGALRERLNEHIRGCPSCAHKVGEVEAIRQALRRAYRNQKLPAGFADRVRAALINGDPPAGLERTRSRAYVAAGAAAACLMVAVFLVSTFLPPSIQPLISVLRGPPVASLYQDLAENPGLQAAAVANLSSPSNRVITRTAIALYREGKYQLAAELVEAIRRQTPGDLGAVELMAILNYTRGNFRGAYELALYAHAARQDAAQCWITLQIALQVGDAARIDQECAHLDAQPEYNGRTRAILGEVRRRKALLPG